MASVKKITLPSKDIRWRVRYYDPSGMQREKRFKKKVNADRFSSQVESEIDRGDWIDPKGAQTPFGEWLDRYEKTKVKRRASTKARDESLIKNHVKPPFAERTLGSIQPIEVSGWVTDLCHLGLAPDTVRKAYQLLSGALEAAVENGLISRNPARKVELPADDEDHDQRILQLSDMHSLAEAIDPRFRALILVGAYAGLRLGEALGLTASNVNQVRRTLRVDQALSEVNGVITLGSPKTKASRRTISIPKTLARALSDHLSRYAPSNGPIFTSPTGRPVHRTNFRVRYWLPAVDLSVGAPLRYHDLRHSHASLLIKTGQHPKVIQQRLGHRSVRTTLDIYGHLFDGLDEAAADALDDLWIDESKGQTRVGR